MGFEKTFPLMIAKKNLALLVFIVIINTLSAGILLTVNFECFGRTCRYIFSDHCSFNNILLSLSLSFFFSGMYFKAVTNASTLYTSDQLGVSVALQISERAAGKILVWLGKSQA